MHDGTVAPPRGSTGGRAVVALLVVGMVAMWAYVLFLAFGPGRQPARDRLDDPAFALAAQVRCREALDQVATLPRAVDATSAEDRADVVAEANEAFGAMLDDLGVLVPSGEDGRLVRAWLADWETYLHDRESYASELRDDPAAQLLVSAKDREQITEYLDAFAADNHMPACSTPLDV
jgi:hypothetical protein